MQTKPKRPSKRRKLPKASYPRFLAHFNDHVSTFNTALDEGVESDEGLFGFEHESGRHEIYLFTADKVITCWTKPTFDPYIRSTQPWKLREIRPEDVDRMTWHYATVRDFKRSGFPKPTCDELSTEQADAFLKLAHAAITAHPDATSSRLEWQGVEVVADTMGAWVDARSNEPGVRMHAFVLVDGWRPFTFRNGGQWCPPPANAKPYGVFWLRAQA